MDLLVLELLEVQYLLIYLMVQLNLKVLMVLVVLHDPHILNLLYILSFLMGLLDLSFQLVQ